MLAGSTRPQLLAGPRPGLESSKPFGPAMSRTALPRLDTRSSSSSFVGGWVDSIAYADGLSRFGDVSKYVR